MDEKVTFHHGNTDGDTFETLNGEMARDISVDDGSVSGNARKTCPRAALVRPRARFHARGK